MTIARPTTATATWAVTRSTSNKSNSAQASPYQWMVKPSGIHEANHVVPNELMTTVEMTPIRLTKKNPTRSQTAKPPRLTGSSRRRLAVRAGADCVATAISPCLHSRPYRAGCAT